jgi:hypothetical protein
MRILINPWRTFGEQILGNWSLLGDITTKDGLLMPK